MRCYGCMKEKPNNEDTCPYCGYVNNSSTDEHYYLPEGSMLCDRYLIGRVLGHGGFGITYIGFDTNLHITVAIKEYLPTDVATRALGEVSVTIFSGEKQDQFEYGQKRFLDEARTLASYHQHPCIVDTRDFVRANNTSYLVMEFLDGIPLSEYLKRKGGSVPFQEALEIMMPVMDALREVHKSGMIHRDISPDNIYITKTGQVKLLDFGAARFALGEKSKSLSVILKPGYAPPEQYTSRGKQGAWTDVYAVASTLYRMVEGKNLYEAMDRMMDDSIDFTDNTPTEYRDAFERALKVKVDERLQSVESFQVMLESVMTEDVPIPPQYHELARPEPEFHKASSSEMIDSKPIDSSEKETSSQVALGDNIIDVMQIKKIEKMHQLELYNMSISKLINLGQITWLEELDVSYNKLRDLDGLEHLSNLAVVDISSNEIKDISKIIFLPELYSLNIANNLIVDVSMLSSLKKLKYLWLVGNPIQDNLENRQALIELYERGCYINGSPFMK